MTPTRPTLTTKAPKAPSARTALPRPTTDLSSASALKNLDFLVAFYHRERGWACETRASLQGAFRLSPVRPDDDLGRGEESSDDNGSESEGDEEKGHEGTDRFKSTEGQTRATKSSSPSTDSLETESEITAKPASTTDSVSKGTREKRVLKRRPYEPTHRILPSQPGLHILKMFENIMEERMESCQRIQRLVRKANRRDILAAASTR